MPTPKRPFKRASPSQMEVRRYRILGWLQAGLSNEEIAGLEGITRRRVRQIVAEALKARDQDLHVDRRLLAEVRLGPALRLAAKAIMEGKLEGVDRLVKVLDRLDKLGPAPRPRVYDENARAKLMAKLNLNLGRLTPDRAETSEIGPEVPASL